MFLDHNREKDENVPTPSNFQILKDSILEMSIPAQLLSNRQLNVICTSLGIMYKSVVIRCKWTTRFFYISNQFISNQGSGFLKITIEYNGLLLCWTMENNRNFKQLWGLELSQVAYK